MLSFLDTTHSYETGRASTVVWIVESSSGRGGGVSSVQAFLDATHSYCIRTAGASTTWSGMWRVEVGEEADKDLHLLRFMVASQGSG